MLQGSRYHWGGGALGSVRRRCRPSLSLNDRPGSLCVVTLFLWGSKDGRGERGGVARGTTGVLLMRASTT